MGVTVKLTNDYKIRDMGQCLWKVEKRKSIWQIWRFWPNLAAGFMGDKIGKLRFKKMKLTNRKKIKEKKIWRNFPPPPKKKR